MADRRLLPRWARQMMMGPDPYLVSFSYLVRWLHVAAMAGLVGGAILVWAMSLRAPPDGEGGLLAVAQTYEWIFWLSVGLLVMTGVGNLGAYRAAVPERETDWGGKLTIKLAVVGVFTLLSLARTLLVVLLGAAPDRGARSRSTILLWSYAGSVVLAAAIVGVAVSLAHG